MKKYRLIKKFPSSGAVGTIVYPMNTGYSNGGALRYFENEVENYPEFWELVVEKSPLFTTEDGVDIFKGDSYWQVNREFKEFIIENPVYQRRPFDKYFSTEKAAKKYIDLNQPKYSTNKILDTFERIGWTHEMYTLFRDIIK